MDTPGFESREIDCGSGAYQAYTALRDRVLRQPLGLTFSLVDLEQEPGYRHFGLFDDDTILATAMVVPHPDGAVQVRQMAVEFGWQGKGLGRQLLTAVEHRLQTEGFDRLFLHARDIAVGFYRRLGYVPVGPPFAEVGIPHQRMEKRLPWR